MAGGGGDGQAREFLKGSECPEAGCLGELASCRQNIPYQ